MCKHSWMLPQFCVLSTIILYKGCVVMQTRQRGAGLDHVEEARKTNKMNRSKLELLEEVSNIALAWLWPINHYVLTVMVIAIMTSVYMTVLQAMSNNKHLGGGLGGLMKGQIKYLSQCKFSNHHTYTKVLHQVYFHLFGGMLNPAGEHSFLEKSSLESSWWHGTWTNSILTLMLSALTSRP